MIPIASLNTSGSPRLAGENADHIRMLAEVDGEMPPIVVHRQSMRVIDGVHRLRAAELRGAAEILGSYFDGPEIDAFVLAVEANTTHGLPLSSADRIAAAARIVDSCPHWSNRAIAASAGIATKTVARLRARAAANVRQLDTRVGLDGRSRPVDGRERRQEASRLLQSNPDASLRAIARIVGISPTTVRDVRERLRGGADPVPNRSPDDSPVPFVAHHQERRRTSHAAAIRSLQSDPSLRFTEAGRALLRLLNTSLLEHEVQSSLIDNLPPHCVATVTDAARACAAAWQEFALELSRRRDHSTA